MPGATGVEKGSHCLKKTMAKEERKKEIKKIKIFRANVPGTKKKPKAQCAFV
jgi:riboflavin synthase